MAVERFDLCDRLHVTANTKREIDLLIKLDYGGKSLFIVSAVEFHGLHSHRNRPLSGDIVFRAACQKKANEGRKYKISFHDHLPWLSRNLPWRSRMPRAIPAACVAPLPPCPVRQAHLWQARRAAQTDL